MKMYVMLGVMLRLGVVGSGKGKFVGNSYRRTGFHMRQVGLPVSIHGAFYTPLFNIPNI